MCSTETVFFPKNDPCFFGVNLNNNGLILYCNEFLSRLASESTRKTNMYDSFYHLILTWKLYFRVKILKFIITSGQIIIWPNQQQMSSNLNPYKECIVFPITRISYIKSHVTLQVPLPSQYGWVFINY